MTFNKLAVSALNGALEIQPALANINFDFTLWKVAPPKEFEGVGAALTTIRRDEAENGCAHRTARQLGALFEKLLPPTPKLIKAYGQRASEISQASIIDVEARAAYGVFASRVGADATSLWAAATSGSSAIAVHLLACLLARIWEGPQATSIWVELTERRKKEIKDSFEIDNICDLATLGAAQQELTRSQISEWDASARAWLRVADIEKCRQQKQLMLILENVQAPVNNKADTYNSVISAWNNALLQMEGLINGVSQEAQGGDIVLGLSAWHLYPDLMVVAPRPTPVRQRDPIFAHGGVLTIGLVNPNTMCQGVHWSLPLAHLRHYGVPVISSTSIDSNERSRISTSELLLATFGCVLQGWGEAGHDTVRAAIWLDKVFRLLEKSCSAGRLSARILLERDAARSWFFLLMTAARQYLESQGNERKIASKLILLGRRHGKRFLDRPAEPLFGLLGLTNMDGSDNFEAYLSKTTIGAIATGKLASPHSVRISKANQRGCYVSLISTDEDKIHFLRKVAQDIAAGMSLDPTEILIRYKHHYPKWPKNIYEYATALPWQRSTVKRKADDNESGADGHKRWLYGGGCLRNGETTVGELFEFHGRKNAQGQTIAILDTHTVEEQRLIREDFETRRQFYESLGEEIIEQGSQFIEHFDSWRVEVSWDRIGYVDGSRQKALSYELLYGDELSVGLLVATGKGNLLDLVRPTGSEAADFFRLFEEGKIDAASISDQLLKVFVNANAEVDPHLKALKAVSTAAAMYQQFPNTTVDVRILQQPLWNTAWVKNCHQTVPRSQLVGLPSSLQSYHLDRATAFACIAMFESGVYDINPSFLENVIAMSSGESIYIGSALLLDPQDVAYSGDIRRVLGNIGRPGMAFLVPPVDPMIREVKMSDWPRIDRDDFDGEMRDCFESTSLHLSFTGANTPVNIGFSGGQDVDVYMLETVISIRDGGEWVADLDVFNSICSLKLWRIGNCQDHKENSVVTTKKFTAINNWLELIDTPETPLNIVRAYRNWQARLAATTLTVVS